MGDGSVVSNCLLRHNYGWIGTIFIGGGLVVNSMITSNYGQGIGGVFSYGGTVRNCLIANNVGNAIQQQNEGSGGGYFQNCTVVSNGAGINFLVRAHIENCIVYDNASGNYNAGGIWTNSCTTPMPAGTYDTNNITNAPAFADKAAGIFRLSAASPCIDRGIYRKWMTNAVDLDGRTRIRYGTVDMGAYEYIGNGTLFRAW